jgi:hypothetical protein
MRFTGGTGGSRQRPTPKAQVARVHQVCTKRTSLIPSSASAIHYPFELLPRARDQNGVAADTTTTISTPTGMVGLGDREYLSLFPPFFMRTTTFQEFQPGLYGLTQPLAINPESGGFDVKLRMTVAKLGDGSLLVRAACHRHPD